jgi:hypothetical protein
MIFIVHRFENGGIENFELKNQKLENPKLNTAVKGTSKASKAEPF